MNSRISRFPLAAGLLGIALAAARPAFAQTAATEPLTLRRAVQLALERAPQLAAVKADREGERASAGLAKDVFHPSAYLSTNPGYTYGVPGLVAGRVPSIAMVEIRQAIYDPGRRSEALQAEARVSGMDAEVERSCRDTIEKTIAAYARGWVDQALADIARRRLDAAETIRTRVEALAGEGRRTDLDRERARLQGARARQKLLNAESDRDLDLLELKRLIGWPGSAPLSLSDPESAISELPAQDNLAAARAADPELKSLSREIELLGSAARMESRWWSPVIEASAQYQRLARYNNFDKYFVTFTPDSVAVGVSIGIPLWTGGRSADSARRARARLDHAQAQLAARESDLEMAVKRAEADVARATAERSLSRRSQGIAEQALSASQLLVREGATELTALDESQLALSDADEEAAKAALSSLVERVRLLALRGELAAALLGSDPPCASR